MDSLHMKITLLVAALLALAGCRDESELPAAKVNLGGAYYVQVHVVTVDGLKYVVAASSHGVAICPATK